MPAPRVYPLDDARARLKAALPGRKGWFALTSALPADDLFADPPPRRSVLASAFAAGLELAKEGAAELRQDAAFAPLYLRGKAGGDAGPGAGAAA